MSKNSANNKGTSGTDIKGCAMEDKEKKERLYQTGKNLAGKRNII